MQTDIDVLLIGAGDLGGWVAECLPRLSGMEDKRFVLADIHEEAARKRVFSVWAGASYLNRSLKMESAKMDLLNIDETGELLRKWNPRIVCNMTSLQSWWVVDALPKEIWSRLETEAGFGPWIPMHLTLTHRLMQAIQKYGIKTLVVNCSFPDLTNPVLGSVGLAPTCGIGNADLLLPGIRREVARRINIPVCAVLVYLVAHHSHCIQFMILKKPGTPYHLKIIAGDQDVTKRFDPDELILSGMRDWLPGRHFHPVVAASAAKNIRNLLLDSGELSYVPGPNGEIGGYPVRMWSRGVEVVLPEGITMEEARKINADAQKKDGIERIEKDGTVVFTDEASSLMKELMGYECKTMKIEESDERAKELLLRYKELKKKHGLF